MAKIKNIYGSELKNCNSNSNHQLKDSSINGYCNESKNGYHNICISMNPYISNNFLEITGQGSWSKTKEGKNHYICQGAWANYVAKLKENKEVDNYIINHTRRGCYEVILKIGETLAYLTNFKNKKAAERFIEAHKKDMVTIDPETCVPTPDFK